MPQKRKSPAASRPAGRVTFIEPMECLPVAKIPEGPEWTYEIKLDGYRLEAIKNAREVSVYSRRRTILNKKFPYIAAALKGLPPATILDGEIVALDEKGVSNFNLLQSFRSSELQIHYYAFDILALKGKYLAQMPLEKRREILHEVVEPNDHVSLSVVERKSATQILKFVRQHGLEGVVAKRADSAYEPGKRSGLWTKTRVNREQEFVIGGYTRGSHGFDALIVGFYVGDKLKFAARVRAGFVPATRNKVFQEIKHLKIPRCPFSNLPEKEPGRWGAGLTAEKMKSCVWLKPETVVRIEFREWTGADRLRHTKFVALRNDKDPEKVIKETE